MEGLERSISVPKTTTEHVPTDPWCREHSTPVHWWPAGIPWQLQLSQGVAEMVAWAVLAAYSRNVPLEAAANNY